MTSRVFLVLAAVAVLVLLVFVGIELRGRPKQMQAEGSTPAAAAGQPTRPGAAIAPPGSPQSELTPELAASRAESERLAHGELPYPPPNFADSGDRDRFKRWWVGEMIRRADVIRQMEPKRRYPSNEETGRMMDRLYDLAERPSGATAVTPERQAQYTKFANKEFVAAFGVPASEIVRRGADPKYGKAPTPPVIPPSWRGP